MDNLPVDIIRHINSFGAGHRGAFNKVLHQITFRRVMEEFMALNAIYMDTIMTMAGLEDLESNTEWLADDYVEENWNIDFEDFWFFTTLKSIDLNEIDDPVLVRGILHIREYL